MENKWSKQAKAIMRIYFSNNCSSSTVSMLKICNMSSLMLKLARKSVWSFLAHWLFSCKCGYPSWVNVHFQLPPPEPTKICSTPPDALHFLITLGATWATTYAGLISFAEKHEKARGGVSCFSWAKLTTTYLLLPASSQDKPPQKWEKHEMKNVNYGPQIHFDEMFVMPVPK